MTLVLASFVLTYSWLPATEAAAAAVGPHDPDLMGDLGNRGRDFVRRNWHRDELVGNLVYELRERFDEYENGGRKGMNIKKIVKRTPILGPVSRRVKRKLFSRPFHDSEGYWVDRYAKGGDSGAGSYSKLAQYKAETLNEFVRNNDVRAVMEYGCGDGNQLRLAAYPSYMGFDVAPGAISRCKEVFGSDPSKTFKLVKDYDGERAELTLSLDVVYHLVEDEVFESYMRTLFDSSDRFVIIYSSDCDTDEEAQTVAPSVKRSKLYGQVEVAEYVRHRNFTEWVDKNLVGWNLIEHRPNRHPFTGDPAEGSFADFYIYEKD